MCGCHRKRRKTSPPSLSLLPLPVSSFMFSLLPHIPTRASHFLPPFLNPCSTSCLSPQTDTHIKSFISKNSNVVVSVSGEKLAIKRPFLVCIKIKHLYNRLIWLLMSSWARHYVSALIGSCLKFSPPSLVLIIFFFCINQGFVVFVLHGAALEGKN